MKKKLLFMIPLLLCGLFMFANHKETRAAIISENYSYTQPASCPYSVNYSVNTGARYRWIKINGVNYIQIQAEVGTRYRNTPSWAGTDYFWLFNDRLNQTFQTWSFVRDLTGTPYSMYGTTVYRKETIWYTIEGEKPNKPTGYFSRNDAIYTFNVSGTANGTATYSHDYYHVRPGGGVNYVPVPGTSASAEDYITGFYYLINNSPTSVVTPTTPGVQLSENGIIDVSSAFKSGTLQYIHVVARSYTGKLSDCLDAPIQDASLLKTLTLNKDVGIDSVTGAGSYYPYQTVTINATPKEGYAFASWNKTINTKNYTFTMPNANITYTAYSEQGAFTKPTLTVSNPKDPGIYQLSDNFYYVKADDTTKINLVGTCVLNPVARSRIDEVSLSSSFLPDLFEKYQLSVPRPDVVGGIFLPGNIVPSKSTLLNPNVYSKDEDKWIIDTYTPSTFKFSKAFVARGTVPLDIQIAAHASCVECTEKAHQIDATGDKPITIQGDNIAPTSTISVKDTLREDVVPMEFFDTNWTNANEVTFYLEDTISGIKSYELSKNGVVKSTNTYDTRITQTDFNFSVEEGINQYTLTLTDNVGNIRVYTFSLKVDKTKPSITDMDTAFGTTNVKATNGPWNKTNVDTTWDYNWTKEKLLSYLAEDVSGIRNLDIYNYGTDETYKTIQSQQNIIKNATTASALKSISFENTTGILNGKSYLKLVVEDLAGNKTTVNVVVRMDNQMPTIQNFQASGPNLNRPISEINEKFESGTIDMSEFPSGIQFDINENFSTDDTSGIQKVEVLCKDPTTGTVLKTYDVTEFITSAVETKESISGTSLFTPLTRNLSGSYSFGINTAIDLPTDSALNICIQTTDYAGNVATSEDQKIANYAIKAVIYSTKEKAYNLPVNDGKNNVAYFKTGEVGYIEVWTVGYVDKLELDFSNQGIGQVANTAIANKQLLPKYILGVKNAGMANARYVMNVKDFKVPSSAPDVNGVPFASHIKYTPDEVNQSVGDFGINGWAEKGTMIRIPPSLTLTPKGEKDKDGNQLYHWKNCIASVYAFKNNVEGPIPSSCQYTIWDESGDDIHYRVIHQMLKK